MQPIEWYNQHADELAQQVVDAWTNKTRTGNPPTATDEFRLFELASQYRIAKTTADRRDQFVPDLKKGDQVEEKAARQAFAEACKAYSEKKERGASA